MNQSLHYLLFAALGSCVDGVVNAPQTPTIASVDPLIRESPIGTSSSAPPKARRPDAFSVVLRDLPKGFASDGDLGEWGSLEPREPTALNPTNGRTRIAIAVDATSVKLAADLGGLLKDGFTISLSTTPPPLAPIGEFFGRSGSPVPHDCEFVLEPGIEGSVDRGRKKTAKETRKCNQELAAYAALTATQESAYATNLRVHASGIVERKESGGWVALANVKHRSRTTSDSSTLEFELPIGVLPRLTEAPWLGLDVGAGPLDTASTVPSERITFPTPVAFEPLADLRARTFAGILIPAQKYSRPTQFPAGLSYHPAQPTLVRSLSHAGPNALKVEEDVLYRKQAELGDVEVGLVHAYGDFLVIRKKGVITEFLSLFGDLPVEYAQPFRIKGIVERAGELQVIGFLEAGITQRYGWRYPGWAVIAVDAAGQIRERSTGPAGFISSQILDDVELGYPVQSAKESSDKELLALRMKGTAMMLSEEPKLGSFDVTLRWNADTKRYRTTTLPRR